jgi:hypothetical protein
MMQRKPQRPIFTKEQLLDGWMTTIDEIRYQPAFLSSDTLPFPLYFELERRLNTLSFVLPEWGKNRHIP